MSRILIVEDEVIVARDIKQILEHLGYAVPAIALTGEEAIKKTRNFNPDLVLIDIKLRGDIDGIAAASQIRDEFGIPIIYLTAYADETTLQRAKLTEPFGYLLKPFEGKELHSAIEVALYKHGMERKLKEKEMFNFALFEFNPVQTIIVDREGRIVNFNLAKKKSGDRLPKIGDVMYKDYAGRHEIDMSAELMNCIKSGQLKEFSELRYGDKFLSVTIAPFAKGAIITSEDITEKKKFHDQIIEEMERWQATFDAISDPVVIITQNFKILRTNRALIARLKKPYSEIVGHPCYRIIHQDGRQPAACPLQQEDIDEKITISRFDNLNFPGNYICTSFPLKTDDQNLIVHYFRDVTREEQANQMLHELSWRIFSAQEDERKRIARELHDEVSQDLTVLKLDGGWLRSRLQDVDPKTKDHLDSICERADSLIEKIRGICFELRPAILDEIGLVNALEKLAEDFSIVSGLRCQVQANGDAKKIPPKVATVGYRVTSEALTNVLKHAQGSEVVIQLAVRDEGMLLSILDNGIGISNEVITVRGSLGLYGMVERVRSVGGTLDIRPGAIGGTVVTAFFPLR